MNKLRTYIRKILQEAFESADNITAKDVFALIQYHDSYKDLYPGYSPEHENEYETDYYFSSKREAYNAVKELLNFYKNLSNPIPIYRAIRVNKLEDVNQNYLGDSWSYNKSSALNFAKIHNGGNVLLSAKIPKESVDWKETIRNHFLFSNSYDESNEDEIKVADTDALLDIKVDWIKNTLKESLKKPVKLNRYLYHVANPLNRDRIQKNGIIPYRGEQWLSDTKISGKAVFATNSDNPKDWFDSTFDDDVWRIDTNKIPNIKWFMDPNFDWDKKHKHIYTQNIIPVNAIELIKTGTGNSLD